MPHVSDLTPPPLKIFAFVLSVSAIEHTRIVTLRCPFCAATHAHGWPYGDRARLVTIGGRRVAGLRSIGHRVADCNRGSGYDVLVPAALVLAAPNSGARRHA